MVGFFWCYTLALLCVFSDSDELPHKIGCKRVNVSFMCMQLFACTAVTLLCMHDMDQLVNGQT